MSTLDTLRPLSHPHEYSVYPELSKHTNFVLPLKVVEYIIKKEYQSNGSNLMTKEFPSDWYIS